LLLRGCCLLSGGSTNAVLHLIAMSRAAGLNVTLDDFQRVSDKVREGGSERLRQEGVIVGV